MGTYVGVSLGNRVHSYSCGVENAADALDSGGVNSAFQCITVSRESSVMILRGCCIMTSAAAPS